MFNPEYIIYIWLIVGCVFIAVEAFGVPGLGFLFSGLAALCVAIILHIGIINTNSYLIQAGAFFALTALWALVLWKPIYKRIKTSDEENINDVVGKIGTVLEGGLKKGEKGKVYWSGTHFVARIAEDCDCELIGEGREVKIIDIQGNTLIVEPKK